MEIENRDTIEEDELFNCFNSMLEQNNENEQQDIFFSNQQKIESDVENLLSIDLINHLNEDETMNGNEQNKINTPFTNVNTLTNDTNEKEASNSDIELALIEDETISSKPNQYQPSSNPHSQTYNTNPIQKLSLYPQLSPYNKSFPFFYNQSPYPSIAFPKTGWVCTQCKNINYHIRTICTHCGYNSFRNYAHNPQSRFSQNNLHINGNAFKFSPLLFASQEKMLNMSGDNIRNEYNKLSPVMSPVNGSCSKKKKPFIEREGDWICAKCKNLNFAFRVRCNRCNKIKEEEKDIKVNNDKERIGK